MAGLLGSHSTNPGGTQGLLPALQTLKSRADAGDAGARATLQAIAAGGTTRGSSVPGWNEDINWGAADTGHGNTGGRAADRALASAVLSGNTNNINSIEANKAATHTDWNGGTLAKIAPMALAAIPGIGVPLALGAGAAMGAAERATGLTKGSVLGGAVEGAGMAGGGMALKGIGTAALGGAAAAAPGAAADAVPGMALGDVANAGVSAAAPASSGVLSAIGSYAAKNPSVIAPVLGAGASIYGSTLMGKAEDQQAAIAQQAANDASAESQRRLNRVPFAVWKARRDAAAGGAPTV